MTAVLDPTGAEQIGQAFAPTGTADDALEFWTRASEGNSHGYEMESTFGAKFPVHMYCTPLIWAVLEDTVETFGDEVDLSELSLPDTGSLLLQDGKSGWATNDETGERARFTYAGFTWTRLDAGLLFAAWAYESGQMHLVTGTTVPNHLLATCAEDGIRILAALDLWINTAATREDTFAGRPARRRYQKATGNEAPSVVKLKLRHLESQEHQGGTHAPAKYDHRWIVAPHWRNQACGPGHAERKRVRVAPYIKGPVDAPLKIKNQIWKLDR